MGLLDGFYVSTEDCNGKETLFSTVFFSTIVSLTSIGSHRFTDTNKVFHTLIIAHCLEIDVIGKYII